MFTFSLPVVYPLAIFLRGSNVIWFLNEPSRCGFDCLKTSAGIGNTCDCNLRSCLNSKWRKWRRVGSGGLADYDKVVRIAEVNSWLRSVVSFDNGALIIFRSRIARGHSFHLFVLVQPAGRIDTPVTQRNKTRRRRRAGATLRQGCWRARQHWVNWQ